MQKNVKTVIVNNSTNINKTNNHYSPKKAIEHTKIKYIKRMTFEIQALGRIYT